MATKFSKVLVFLLLGLGCKPLLGCRSEEVRDFAAERGVDESLFEETSQLLDTEIPSREELESTHETLRETVELADKAEEKIETLRDGYQEARTMLAEAADSTRSTAEKVARSLPRSRKEANKMALSYGQIVLKTFRERMNRFMRENRKGLVKRNAEKQAN